MEGEEWGLCKTIILNASLLFFGGPFGRAAADALIGFFNLVDYLYHPPPDHRDLTLGETEGTIE